MQKFFNNRPSLEEFVDTYKNLMLNDLKKLEQEEDYSQAEKDTIKSERYLSFEILDDLLASTKVKGN